MSFTGREAVRIGGTAITGAGYWWEKIGRDIADPAFVETADAMLGSAPPTKFTIASGPGIPGSASVEISGRNPFAR
jgi:hypothetical protein